MGAYDKEKKKNGMTGIKSLFEGGVAGHGLSIYQFYAVQNKLKNLIQYTFNGVFKDIRRVL